MADDIDIEFGKTTDNEYKETAKHIVLNAHAISKSCTNIHKIEREQMKCNLEYVNFDAHLLALRENEAKYSELREDNDGRLLLEQMRLLMCGTREDLEAEALRQKQIDKVRRILEQAEFGKKEKDIYEEALRQRQLRKLVSKRNTLEARIINGLESCEALLELDKKKEQIEKESETYMKEFSGTPALRQNQVDNVAKVIIARSIGKRAKRHRERRTTGEAQQKKLEAKLEKASRIKQQLNDKIAGSNDQINK